MGYYVGSDDAAMPQRQYANDTANKMQHAVIMQQWGRSGDAVVIACSCSLSSSLTTFASSAVCAALFFQNEDHKEEHKIV